MPRFQYTGLEVISQFVLSERLGPSPVLSMIVKTENFELEISAGTDVYFGSRTSGQIFKK